MTIQSLDDELERTSDLKAQVDLYNRFFAVNRDNSPLDMASRLERAIILSHRSAYSRGLFETLIHRAYYSLQISEKTSAEEDIGRIKQIYREDSGWDRENMFFYHLLSLYYCGKSYTGLCADYAYRCLTLSRRLNNQAMTASVKLLQGRMSYKMGKLHEAEELYRQSLNVLLPGENDLLIGTVNCRLGELYASSGRTPGARCYFHQAYRILKEHSPGSRGYAWVLRKFAAFEEGVGNLATAEYLYGEAVAALENRGYQSLTAEFRLALGRLLLSRGLEEGLHILNEQRTILLEQGSYDEVLQIGDLLSNYYLEQGDEPSAVRELLAQRKLTREMLKNPARRGDDSFEKEQWMTARENLTRVNRLGIKLAASQSRKEIFLVLREALGFLGEEDGLLVAEERPDNQLKLIYGRIHGKNVVPHLFPNNPGESMMAYCLKHNQSLLVDDMDEEGGFFINRPVKRLKLEEESPRSHSLLNLVYRRESGRGVISLQSTEKRAFHFHHLEFIKSLLPFLTVALDNEEKTGMIRKLSTLDSLTGLMIRREFMRILKNSWSAHSRSGDPLSILMVDIDHFKSINDRFGHKAGDEGLVGLSRLLNRHFQRTTDTCCRYGGEEFIILSGYTDWETCNNKAEELRREVEKLVVQVGEEEISFTVSIGTATVVPTDSIKFDDLIQKADISLYSAKNRGRNCVVPHADITPFTQALQENQEDLA
ncbi:MAG: GGDEF domain-containing protein [Spirochaetales bacterium]|nr:GGDEF domain-containing protein [Spirochaetales bacterium]